MVFGCARPPSGEQLLDHDAHTFLLTPGQALPVVWIALCGHLIGHTEFEALDQGVGPTLRGLPPTAGRPPPPAHLLALRSPGEHMHPQLRRLPLAGPSHGGGCA